VLGILGKITRDGKFAHAITGVAPPTCLAAS